MDNLNLYDTPLQTAPASAPASVAVDGAASLTQFMVAACEKYIETYLLQPMNNDTDDEDNNKQQQRLIDLSTIRNLEQQTCMPRLYTNKTNDLVMTVVPTPCVWLQIILVAAGELDMCLIDSGDILDWRRIRCETESDEYESDDEGESSTSNDDSNRRRKRTIVEGVASPCDMFTLSEMLGWTQQQHSELMLLLKMQNRTSHFNVALDRTVFHVRQRFLPVGTVMRPVISSYTVDLTELIPASDSDCGLMHRDTGPSNMFCLYSSINAVSAQLYEVLVLSKGIVPWNLYVWPDIFKITMLHGVLYGGNMYRAVQQHWNTDQVPQGYDGLYGILCRWFHEKQPALRYNLWRNCLFEIAESTRVHSDGDEIVVPAQEVGFVDIKAMVTYGDMTTALSAENLNLLNGWMSSMVYYVVTYLLHRYIQPASTMALCSMPIVDPTAPDHPSVPPYSKQQQQQQQQHPESAPSPALTSTDAVVPVNN